MTTGRRASWCPATSCAWETAFEPRAVPHRQRILREYKRPDGTGWCSVCVGLSKRIVLRGNDTYIHLSTDARVSLHRSDNLFCNADGGTVAPRDDDIVVDLNISTLGPYAIAYPPHPA